MQHLREALWVSRQEAVDSLRHTRGDVEAALRQELAAFAMDLTALRRLAVEYAVHRRVPSPPQCSCSTASCFSGLLWLEPRQVCSVRSTAVMRGLVTGEGSKEQDVFKAQRGCLYVVMLGHTWCKQVSLCLCLPLV